MAATSGSETLRARILRFFHEADVDGNGYLTLDEFSKALKRQGYKMSQSQIKKQFARFDLARDDRISRDEFLACLGEIPDHVHESATVRRMFAAYDKNGDGVIDRREIEAVFRDMTGSRVSASEVDRLMRRLDRNQNGTIEYEEFVQFFAGCRKPAS